MKKLCSLIAVASGVMVAPNLYAAFDGTITIGGGGPQQFQNGGAFNATTTPLSGSPTLGAFQTFCIELHEDISFAAATYDYRINTGAVGGGGGANATDPFTGGSMDNVSMGTAWLYSQFRAGTLVDYNGTAASAGALQNAIWYLENELPASGPNSLLNYNGVSGATFIADAINGTGKTILTGLLDDSHGAYGVVALNLYTKDGAHANAQDQLAMVPVPEASTIFAGALLLLPFAAGTIRGLRKTRIA